ncbi:MAG: 3-hydroxyacyl-CoA dehydrogenase/enoyl-CoA hydratase family protein [Bryobacterales bacterium]|nr:3-hydroxyacyl-CoA dehydrogenase/enoyl-CoA hydratase family protein [Bryobacterales bacterium]
MRKAAVLGAGTMGSRIAAHLANAGVETLLLDLPSPGEGPAARNAVAAKALKGLFKSRPPAFFTETSARRLSIGNFEDDMGRLANVDWIIEAVVERFDIKRQLLDKVSEVRRPGSLVSSNTSGLPIAKLAEGYPDDFRRNWSGTHFFNPPRHMRLLELIPTPETDPAVTAFLEDFCDKRLGKVVVQAHDRPNFIANRIFLFAVMQTIQTMLEQGLSVEEVDALTGQLIGRPRMATFRLADFTGVDICLYVASNLYELVPDDERRAVYAPPEFLKKMVAKGLIGDKAGQGFYKKDAKAPGGRLTLDLDTLEYREAQKPEFPALAEAMRTPDLGRRLQALFASDDRAAKFLWTTLSELFLYAANRIPEVCDDIVAMDTVMKGGFNWEMGIFEMWNAAGVESTVERMRGEGKQMPPLVERVLASPSKSFYSVDQGTPTYFDLASGEQRPVPQKAGVLELSRLRLQKAPVRSNPGASLWDLGDGVALLEFHSKANTLDGDVFEMLAASLDEVESRFDALVIGNQGANFSVGANLQMILGLIAGGDWNELEAAVARVQGLIVSLEACRKPVVAAVHGQALGGGCEILLRSSHVQAAAESYIGLVEVGVGLIPAAGGCTEMMRRATAGLDESDDVTKQTLHLFERIGMAKVASSAEEAQQWGYLSPGDDITMNRDRLLAEAKKAALALALAGYEPKEPQPILVGGRGVRAALELRLWMMRQAMWASDYDVTVGKRLANVLAGGDLTQPSFVSQEYMLGLEREAFLGLCGEQKTRERIEHLLKTGKPLRN